MRSKGPVPDSQPSQSRPIWPVVRIAAIMGCALLLLSLLFSDEVGYQRSWKPFARSMGKPSVTDQSLCQVSHREVSTK